jgi:hypothetical protein
LLRERRDGACLLLLLAALPSRHLSNTLLRHCCGQLLRRQGEPCPKVLAQRVGRDVCRAAVSSRTFVLVGKYFLSSKSRSTCNLSQQLRDTRCFPPCLLR